MTIINPRVKDFRLFPLKTNDKLPLVKWQNDTIYDMEQYIKSSPNYKITSYAIDTGRSSLVVIDCDCKEGEVNGISEFYKLASSNDNEIPPTFSVNTPNNGRHYYFRAPKGVTVKNSVSMLGPGIDVRAEGGYVVGPGSTIIKDDGTEGKYFIDEDEEIADLPKWLEVILTKNTNKNAKKSKSNNQVKTSNSKNSNGETKIKDSNNIIEQRQAFYWAVAKLSDAHEGKRNDTLNKLSYFMGAKRVPIKIASDLVEAAVNVGLSKDEAEKTFNNGYDAGLLVEEQELDQIIKNFNNETQASYIDDPFDTVFYTHVALSHNFQKNSGKELMYRSSEKQWYEYTGVVWNKLDEQVITSYVEVFLEELVLETRNRYPNIPSQIYRLQEKLWAKTNIEAVSSLSRNRYMNNDHDFKFDPNPYYINCKNGVIDILTGKLMNHSKDLFITRYIPYYYDPEYIMDSSCEKILESIHPEERNYMQLMSGQALTGLQPISQVMFFLNGKGSNGKSTFIDLLIKTCGTYGKIQSSGVLLNDKQGGDKYAMVDFEGLRTAVIEELPNSKVLDTSALKNLVGTNSINARPIYGNHKVFDNISTIFVTCNKLPMVNETDHGTWRRLAVFTFPYTYKKNAKDVRGEYDRLGDPKVLHNARYNSATAESFFNWRLQGAMKWAKNKMLENDVPESMLNTVDEWNENNDVMASWIKSKLEKGNGDEFITLEDAYLAFVEHLIERGHPKCTLRHFVDLFTNHAIFFEWHLKYMKGSRIVKEYNRSKFIPNDSNTQIKEDKEVGNFILGVRFK